MHISMHRLKSLRETTVRERAKRKKKTSALAWRTLLRKDQWIFEYQRLGWQRVG